MAWQPTVLPPLGSAWSRTGASIVNNALVIVPGGSASCTLTQETVPGMPDRVLITAIPSPLTSWENATLEATLVITYADGTLRAVVPLDETENIVIVPEGEITQLVFGINNSGSTQVTVGGIKLQLIETAYTTPDDVINIIDTTTGTQTADDIAAAAEVAEANAAANAMAQATAAEVAAILASKSYADTMPLYTSRIVAQGALIGSAQIGELTAGKISTGALQSCVITIDKADSNNFVTISHTGISGYKNGSTAFRLNHSGLYIGAGATIEAPYITGGTFITAPGGQSRVKMFTDAAAFYTAKLEFIGDLGSKLANIQAFGNRLSDEGGTMYIHAGWGDFESPGGAGFVLRGEMGDGMGGWMPAEMGYKGQLVLDGSNGVYGGSLACIASDGLIVNLRLVYRTYHDADRYQWQINTGDGWFWMNHINEYT